MSRQQNFFCIFYSVNCPRSVACRIRFGYNGKRKCIHEQKIAVFCGCRRVRDNPPLLCSHPSSGNVFSNGSSVVVCGRPASYGAFFSIICDGKRRRGKSFCRKPVRLYKDCERRRFCAFCVPHIFTNRSGTVPFYKQICFFKNIHIYNAFFCN